MKKGIIAAGMFQVIIVCYILFMTLYAFGAYVIVESLGPATAAGFSAQGNATNVSSVGGTTAPQEPLELNPKYKLQCSGSDLVSCGISIANLLFSVDTAQTPFAYFNYFTWVFSTLFFIAVAKEFVLPLLDALFPGS